MAKVNRSTRSTSIKLRTQKDGRLYAIALLKRIERVPEGEFASYLRCQPKEDTTRDGPQSDLILRAFERVMRVGSPQAVLGFFVVMTDFIGSARVGYVRPESFQKWEQRGILQYWRLPQHDLSRAGANHA